VNCSELGKQDIVKGTIVWKEVMNQNLDWYSSKEAIRIADNVLLYQHKTGGWPSKINMARIISKRELSKIQNSKENDKTALSIDNGATYTQMRYLGRVFENTRYERFKKSFLQGVDYLIDAQYENGGWPQCYPIIKGYQENITFNDSAMIGVMKILRNIAKGKYTFVDSSRIFQAQKAIEKGLKIILSTQIISDGELTAWCAQYNPIDLKPAGGRSYEPPSISGNESVDIVKFLMNIDNPNTEIIRSVNSAIDWLEQVKITGIRLLKKEDPSLLGGYDLIVGFDSNSSFPIWARFYEIDTHYPMFIGRDGVVKYALSEIEHERRVGYDWFGDWANSLIMQEHRIWIEKWDIKE
tara:strand:+ start:7864 stop:8922 length:1059 start_codon:yes stop_codon:yes gene_type:complete